MNKKQQKSGGGLSAFIAAVCIIIYLFALVQAVVRVYFSFEQCQITAQEEYARIRATAITAGSQGFMDDRFIQTINHALSSTKILEAVIITGADEEYAFEKQKGRAIAWVNRSPRFIQRISFSGHSYYDPLPINNVRNANIKAVANAFNFDDISKILRETLLLILIGFAISFFTMLLQMLLNTKNQETAYAPSDFNTADITSTPLMQPIHEEKPLEPIEPLYSPAEESGPKGLYSARSNIGWEEYTKDRLNAEIHRCASSEKDLAFLMLEFANTISDNSFREIAEDAAVILSSKDMLFEYGEKGFCAILPGIDLSSAISKSEKFYEKVRHNRPDVDLNIGLTSRSGRLLDADRLLLEGREALQRAKLDSTTSIIAFKSDPEKYRAYISQQG